MTFASDTQKPDSRRFALVRLLPKRYLTNGILIAPNTYRFLLEESVLALDVSVNGVGGIGFTRNDTTIDVVNVANLADPGNITVVTHGLFFTSEKFVQTESVAGLPDASWEPRLLGTPDFSQSVSNLTEGTFSLSSSDITFASTDRLGQKYCGPNDSFGGAECKVWYCIDTVDVNQVVFIGKVVSVSMNDTSVSLNVLDIFDKLQKTAQLGSTNKALVFTGNVADSITQYPMPEDENTPVPLIIGTDSPINVKDGWRHLDPYGLPFAKTYHNRGGLRAKKISPQDPDPASAVTFSCGRILADDLEKINFGTILLAAEHTVYKGVIVSTVTQLVPNETSVDKEWYREDKFLYLQCQFRDCEVGDYVPNIGGRSGWVCAVSKTGVVYSTYNVVIAINSYGFFEPTAIGGPPPNTFLPIAVPAFTNNTYPSMSIWIEGGETIEETATDIPFALISPTGNILHTSRYVPFTYTLGSPETVGGESIRNIYATVPALTDGNSLFSNNDVRYRYTTNGAAESKTHAYKALRFLIKSAGMSTNDASFDTAHTADNSQLALTIPFEGNEYPSTLSVIQKICSSVFCILRLNNSSDVEVVRIENTSTATPDYVRDASDVLDGSASASIDYQDVFNKVIFLNEEKDDVSDIQQIGTKATEVSIFASEMSGVEKTQTISHALKSILTNAPRIAGYLNNATVEYTISTSSKDLPTLIGDVVELTNVVVAGSSQTVKAIVLSKSISSDKTVLKLKEIRGVP